MSCMQMALCSRESQCVRWADTCFFVVSTDAASERERHTFCATGFFLMAAALLLVRLMNWKRKYWIWTLLIIFTLSQGGVEASTSVLQSQTKIGSGLDGFTGQFSNSGQAAGVAIGGDINGDNTRDLVLAQGYNSGIGTLYICFMAASSTSIKSSTSIASTTSGLTATNLVSGDQFGYSLYLGGDVNGDGIPDLAVGADNHNDGTGLERGAAYVIFLSRSASVQSYMQISSNSSLSGFTGVLKNYEQFGQAVSLGADLNVDGVLDLAVGAADSDGNSFAGAVWMLFLNTSGIVKSSQKISALATPCLVGMLPASEYFGSSVSMSSGSDVNGDGVLDLAVGSLTPSFNGAAYIMYMSKSGQAMSYTKISNSSSGLTWSLYRNEQFGTAIQLGPDLNADGAPDMLVGVFIDNDGGSSRGAMFVLFLSRPAGALKSSLKISSLYGGLAAGTLNDGDYFGGSVSPAYDVNGDLMPDLIVSSSGDNTGGSTRGAFYILITASSSGIVADNDECYLRTHNCVPFATCTNTLGSFVCTCSSGYCYITSATATSVASSSTATSVATGTPSGGAPSGPSPGGAPSSVQNVLPSTPTPTIFISIRVIIGVVVGVGALLIAICVGVIIYCCCKKKQTVTKTAVVPI